MCLWRRRHWAPEQVPRGGVWGEKGSKRLQKHVERCYGNPAWESSPQFCDGGGLAGASWNEEVQRWEHGCRQCLQHRLCVEAERRQI